MHPTLCLFLLCMLWVVPLIVCQECRDIPHSSENKLMSTLHKVFIYLELLSLFILAINLIWSAISSSL